MGHHIHNLYVRYYDDHQAKWSSIMETSVLANTLIIHLFSLQLLKTMLNMRNPFLGGPIVALLIDYGHWALLKVLMPMPPWLL